MPTKKPTKRTPLEAFAQEEATNASDRETALQALAAAQAALRALDGKDKDLTGRLRDWRIKEVGTVAGEHGLLLWPLPALAAAFQRLAQQGPPRDASHVLTPAQQLAYAAPAAPRLTAESETRKPAAAD